MFCWTVHTPDGILAPSMVLPAFIRPALVLLAAAAVVFLLIAIYRNGVNQSAPVQSASQQLPQNVDVALKQVRFFDMKDGLVDWELVADRVEYDKSGEIARLSGGIRMDFVKNKSHGAISVTADRGEYRTDTRNLRLHGNVHVNTEDGVDFKTEQIDYTAALSRFKTAERVLFSQERLTLRATGMVMDVRDQQARFFKLVDATVAGLSVAGRTVNMPEEKR